MLLGLVGESYNMRADTPYARNKDNRIRFVIAVILCIVFIPILLFYAGRVVVDLYAYEFQGAPLRQITAPIATRKGFPLPFVFPDDMELGDGRVLHMPYSDTPSIGPTYTFTLLPTQDVVLYYVPADHTEQP